MFRKSDLQDALLGWRNKHEKARAERSERRLMKTSTWDALVETMDDDERDPYGWPQSEFEATIGDTAAIEKRRWIERIQWIVLALITAGLGYAGGNYMHDIEKPGPWECIVLVQGFGDKPTILRCTGGAQ